MATIQKGHPDFYGYIDFINYVFGMNGSSRAFNTLLPKLYADGKTSADDTYFAIENEKIVGTVLSYPLTFHIGDATLSARGIGSVATHPRHRGEGLMKALMQTALEDMKKEGVALSVLGGRRGRYAHFGYEKCDAVSYYAVNKASVGYLAPSSEGYSMKKIERDDSALLDLLHSHMHNRAYCVERPREEFYDILVSWQSVPFAFFRGDTLVGYALYHGARRQFSEFELLDASAIGAILALSVQTFGELSIAVPLHEAEKGDLIDRYAETVSALSEECFLVLDYERVLTALLALKAKTVSLADGGITVKIEGYAKTETLRIEVKNGVPTVSPSDETPDITLSHLDAEVFFFRPTAPKRALVAPAVASWLPLPLFIHASDNV